MIWLKTSRVKRLDPSSLNVCPQEGIWRLSSHPSPFPRYWESNLVPNKIDSKSLKFLNIVWRINTNFYNLTLFLTIWQKSSCSITWTMFVFPLLLNPWGWKVLKHDHYIYAWSHLVPVVGESTCTLKNSWYVHSFFDSLELLLKLEKFHYQLNLLLLLLIKFENL